MTISDKDMDRYSDLVLQEGAMGWPTSATLRSIPIEDLYALHDVILTGNLSTLITISWRQNNPSKAEQLQDLLSTLSWPQRRELAVVYIEEISRRETAERERRMERLTWIATLLSGVALIVSIIALLISR